MNTKKLLDFRSNDLRHLTGGPNISGIQSPPPTLRPIFALLDANVLLSIAAHKAQLRKPTARTNLEEGVDAGALRVFATTTARDEFERHFPTFPCKASAERRESAKNAIFSKVHVIEPAPRNSENIQRLQQRDPADVPHAQLFEELGLDVVLSRDNDWDVTDYPRLGLDDEDLVLLLRDYARATSEHLGLHSMVSTGAMMASAVFDGVFGRSSKSSTPTKILTGLAFGGLALAAASLSTPPPEEAPAQPPEGSLKRFFHDWRASRERSLKLSADIEKLLQHRRTPTLSQQVLRILALAAEPLTSHELARELDRAGYSSKANDFHAQLLQLLKAHRHVMACEDGKWRLHVQIAIEETEFGRSVRNLHASLRQRAR